MNGTTNGNGSKRAWQITALAISVLINVFMGGILTRSAYIEGENRKSIEANAAAARANTVAVAVMNNRMAALEKGQDAIADKIDRLTQGMNNLSARLAEHAR